MYSARLRRHRVDIQLTGIAEDLVYQVNVQRCHADTPTVAELGFVGAREPGLRPTKGLPPSLVVNRYFRAVRIAWHKICLVLMTG